jgi:hypothetical protein
VPLLMAAHADGRGGSRAAAPLPPPGGAGRYSLWTAPTCMNTCAVVQAPNG